MLNEDRIEKLVGLGEKLGMNPVRLRWRLRNWSQNGIHLNLSFVTVLVGLNIVAYLKLYISDPGWDFNGKTLFAYGATHGMWVRTYGEYWRLISSQFLHGGIMHLAFNLFALSIIGPRIEEFFGSLKLFSFYIITGAAGFLAACFFNKVMSVGASGAVLGLAGVGCVVGFRDGTAAGKELGQTMLSWLIFSTIAGLFLPIDHASHFGGFAAGALLGLVFRPTQWPSRGAKALTGVVFGICFCLFLLGYIPILTGPQIELSGL